MTIKGIAGLFFIVLSVIAFGVTALVFFGTMMESGGASPVVLWTVRLVPAVIALTLFVVGVALRRSRN